ncbi:hypothetical protein DFH07DRAFT_849364 [Mycena maculata]|uniref:Uncharacterized protein n=1 Tax=Mycena maculata TaxID=230809 RepID=A0AAD7MSJ2_9AGAR|nr:hypothetical protein DFH07DRAFT_849364 [Mycena maculata]
MHRCWDVAEITRIVFELLGPTHWSDAVSPTMKALTALARTCRGFSDPALDLLWESQLGIVPLLKCLPSHVWDTSDGSFVRRFTLFPIH